MLTIFTSPRPFTEQRFAKIQMNGVNSWLQLEPKPRIILFGDERREIGIERLGKLGCEIVGGVRRNQWGTPLLGDLMLKAQSMAKTDLVAWVNADIILMWDFMEAIKKVERQLRQFLLIGGKVRLLGEPPKIDFSRNDWQRYVRKLCKRVKEYQPKAGSDYHVFTNGLFRGRLYNRIRDRPEKHVDKDFPIEYPPIAWGRIRMDTWLVWQCLRREIPVVDASAMILVAHQDHRHIGKRVIPQDDGSKEIGLQDTLTERRASGGGRISNATWILDKRGLRKR